MSHPKRFRHLVRLALFLALMVVALPAWAWGGFGHRVICQIQELNDTGSNEVVQLIALDAQESETCGR